MFGEIENSLRAELRDKEYAEGYSESFLNSYVATQIKVIREQRGMTQAQLAEAIGTTQAGVSRIENVNYSSWNIRTLLKLARAFDVWLKVSFEPYGSLPYEVTRFSRESLERVSRQEDQALRARSEEAAQCDGVVDIGAYRALAGDSTANKEKTGGMLYGTGSNYQSARARDDRTRRDESGREDSLERLYPTPVGQIRFQDLPDEIRGIGLEQGRPF